jgi:Tol biopolymer transport system component
MHIFTISKEGNNLRQITTEADSVAWAPVDWAPDGRSITYFSNNNSIRFIPVEGGESRFFTDIDSANSQYDLAWSPDGKELAYTDNGKIWIYTNESGKSKEVKTGVTGHATKLGWSPDGKKIAFTANSGGDNELWLMENFLPLDKLAQKNEKENVKEPEGIKIRQIWKEPYTDYLGSVSSDGRLRAYVYWGNGDVAVQNLITGENQILTHTADLGDSIGFAQEPVISKNGKQIAYSWWKPNHTYDLLLIDVDNPNPRLLYKEEGVEVYPAMWLSDKVLILNNYNTKTQTAQITSFNISDHSLRSLITFERNKWPQLSCSPDGRYIAYDFANETDNGNFDINILPVDGSNEISVVKHPANDRVLGWVPGKKDFLFISDRSGSWDLWSIPLGDGKLLGQPKRIYTDIGEMKPMGFTQNGDCFVGFSRQNFNTYIAPFNAETGELKEASGKSIIGSNYWVKWSPDGQYLGYTKERQLTVQDLKTGSERKLADNMLLSMSPCWSPDGNSILIVGLEKSKYQTKGYKGGIYMVNVKTGQTTEIILVSDYKYTVPDDDSPVISDIEWSSDGKSIFFLFFKDWLIKHDLETGEDKILYKHSFFERGVLKLSPDGKSLLLGLRYPGEEKSRFLTIPAEGGEEKALCTAQEEKVFTRALWSPDGKYIYFTENREKPNLWRVPAEGGKPQKVWHSENMVEIFSFHPDGNQIAYAIRERTTEVRVIENLVQELEKLDKTPK